MTKLKKYSLGAAIFLVSFAVGRFLTVNPTNITKNAVMIVNKAMNHGGTGVIYQSSKDGSFVLTNKHVCDAIKTGGIVRTYDATYQVQSMLESEVSDLCMVFVPSNLKQNTKLAAFEPETFSPAKVSGHPALMPTIISIGHFSQRAIIPVFIGMRPCTEAEQDDPVCAFFGGFPVVKSYESILVSATIMPGSSGSGVYNSKDELSGLVFAGQGDFGYGWTVPWDQVNAFINNESLNGVFERLDQTLSVNGQKDSGKNIKEILQKCSQETDDKILSFCNVIKRDNTWVK